MATTCAYRETGTGQGLAEMLHGWAALPHRLHREDNPARPNHAKSIIIARAAAKFFMVADANTSFSRPAWEPLCSECNATSLVRHANQSLLQVRPS